ncbi:hypothetical protein V8E55_003446 [Tylopilus felleus]
MPFCPICFLRRFHRTHNQTAGQQYPFLPELTSELEDSRKFSLNSLMALIAIITVSGFKALQPMGLALLIYTISLRVATNSCFFRDFPTVSRFLHVIPLLGVCCVAGVALVSYSQSPTLATMCLLLGVLPLVTVVIHHGRLCGETSSAMALPVQMQDVPGLNVASGSADATGTLASN